jgi:saccharopine dehydrogenase-like NADP-dependent oxidoreductase
MKDILIIYGGGNIGSCILQLAKEFLSCKAFVLDSSEERLLTLSKQFKGVENIEFCISKSELESKLIPNSTKVIVDCTPGVNSVNVASYAKAINASYVSLTEHVKETKEIETILEDSNCPNVLQTGLAPGYVNVLGMRLYQKAKEEYHFKRGKELKMMVGALPQYSPKPHFYGFSWSPIGVATEYIEDLEEVISGSLKNRKGLDFDSYENFYSNGCEYEAISTSGGIASVGKRLEKEFDFVSYKTIRNVGHFEWVQNLIEKNSKNKQPSVLENELKKHIAIDNNDYVLIEVNLSFQTRSNELIRLSESLKIEGKTIKGKYLSGIQLTTSSAALEIVREIFEGKINKKGVVLQDQINPKIFLQSKIIKEIYGELKICKNYAEN